MSKTILVIEDNEKHRFIFEDILTDEGYEVETARDGGEVEKKMADEKRFDLILVDIAVPGFDAIDFIEKHKDKQRIIVVSAYSDGNDVTKLLAEEWRVKKPFDTNELLKKIKGRLALPIGEVDK